MDLDSRVKEKSAASEMWCYQRLSNRLFKDHITNEDVCRKIQAAIGEYEDHMTVVKK